jgi:hypothetical protein
VNLDLAIEPLLISRLLSVVITVVLFEPNLIPVLEVMIPFTSNVVVGAFVPIPTFPLPFTIMRSVPPVLIRTALLYADVEVFRPIKSIQLFAGVCALKRKNPLVLAFDETPLISFDVADVVALGIA